MVRRRGSSQKLLGVAALAAAALAFAGCDWPMSGFDAALIRSSPDTAISSANVSALKLLFTGSGEFGSPVVSNGFVYASETRNLGQSFTLEAFDANGVTNCSGKPNQCTPLWTGSLNGGNASTPAVANGVVYVTTSQGSGTTQGSLYAFDANGITNCSGTPKVCQPLWTAPIGASDGTSAPTVANGVVYVSNVFSSLAAFDANGTTNCSGTPKVCQPLWTASAGGSTPAIANGVVYVSSVPTSSTPATLYAFSANGTTNCSGTPTMCNPLWSASMGSTSTGAASSPSVTNGVVYDESANPNGTLYAFDAGGTTNCSGTPATCSPLWTAVLNGSPQFGSSQAVANHIVYATSSSGVQAFDANGVTNCSGTPKACTPLRSYSAGVEAASPSVANGLLFIGSSSGGGTSGFKFMAFDANGTTNCSGTPTMCSPLWTGVATGPLTGSPAISNGRVYVSDNSFNLGFSTHLYAWALPVHGHNGH